MISTPPPNLKVSKEALTKFRHMDDLNIKSLFQGGDLGADSGSRKASRIHIPRMGRE